MKKAMTKAEARAFKRRWALVNAHEIEELRRTPPEVRLRQLHSMMEMAKSMGWMAALSEGEEDVRARWCKLREAFRG